VGVDVATIAETANFLLSGEVEITKFKDEARGRRYDVRVRLDPENRASPDDIGQIYVRSKDGKLVMLSNIVTLKEGGGASIINRVDRQRAVTLFANLEKEAPGTGQIRA